MLVYLLAMLSAIICYFSINFVLSFSPSFLCLSLLLIWVFSPSLYCYFDMYAVCACVCVWSDNSRPLPHTPLPCDRGVRGGGYQQ